MSKQFSEMTDDEMSTYINNALEAVDNGNILEASKCYEDFKARGAIVNIHLGKSGFSKRETMEWYIGQYLDIVEGRHLFAMNSFLCARDKFAPK